MTVRAYVADVLARARHRHAPRTRRAYQHAALHYLGPLAFMALGAVTADAVREHLDILALELSPKTVRWVRGILAAWFEDACEAGIILENPVRKVKATRYRGDSPPRLVLGRDELATLLRYLQPTPYYAPALASARAGLRPAEAIAIYAEDVDVPGRRLIVRRQREAKTNAMRQQPKGGRPRVVDMSRDLTRELAGASRLVGGLGPLWPQATYRRFLAAVTAAACRADLPPVTPHSLRHSFASLLIADGVSPAYVQRMLGHRSIDLTVRVYGSHIPWRDLDAVDRLDDPAPGRHPPLPVAGRDRRTRRA